MLPYNLYKIIVEQYAVCFMLTSGCFLVIEMKQIENFQQLSVCIFLSQNPNSPKDCSVPHRGGWGEQPSRGIPGLLP